MNVVAAPRIRLMLGVKNLDGAESFFEAKRGGQLIRDHLSKTDLFGFEFRERSFHKNFLAAVTQYTGVYRPESMAREPARS